MVRARTRGVEIISCNTDSQALGALRRPLRIQIGSGVTHGRGAGGDPTLGEKAAEADAKKISRGRSAGSDIVFITAGLGGGTGSGAAPVIARIAKELGALTIAVVTKPFTFEGPARAAGRRHRGVRAWRRTPTRSSRSPTTASGRSCRPGSTMLQAFRTVDEVLHEGVMAIVDVISRTGIVNLDFADVRAIMQDAGPALVGVGHASGEDRALIAARQAISSPLLEAEITGARRILFNVLGSNNLRLDEVTVAADEIRTYADPGATVIFGAGLDKKLGDTLQITVVATGFDLSDEPAVAPSFAATPRLAVEPPTAYAGAADRRAPIDLEAPSYIRRGRRRGDLPLEGPTDRPASPGVAEASEGTEAAGEDRQAEPAGERQRRK